MGKEDALILDVAGSAELGLCTIADLAGMPPGSVKPGKSLLEADEEQAAAEQRKIAVAAAKTRHVDLLRRSDLRWLEAGGRRGLPPGSPQGKNPTPPPPRTWTGWPPPNTPAPPVASPPPP